MLKRVLATVLSAVMAITPATAIQAKAHKSHLYPAAGIVRATYKKSSVVSVKLKNGVIFEFYAEDVKDWHKGDLCAMIIDNNGTKTIYDDMVIDAVNMNQEQRGKNMAKITKDQVNKINAKCKNGFTLSLYTAIIHGEKCLEKDIRIDDSGILYRVSLRFKEKYDEFRAIGVYPVLEIEKYVPCKTEDVYQVLGVRSEKLGEIVNRRSMKVLQDLTADYPDEKLVSLIREVFAA